jgi:peptidylprolyl isomerase
VRRTLAALAAVVLLAACNGDDKPTAKNTFSPSPTVPVVIATAKPKVTVPKGPPPERMTQTDLIVGTGAHVFPGQVASVQYVGVLYRNGEQFDSSWDTGHPFAFEVGGGEVIEGWDKGLLGMRVGGRRMLVIPPAEAYGADEGNELQHETLVFVIDLISTGGSPAGGDEQ